MTAITPSPSYLESKITSMYENGYSHAELVELLFGIIDEYCNLLPKAQGAGRPPTYPLCTILKVDMLMHLTGKCGETEILREVNRHYRTYFDKLPGQSRLWHRLREALGEIERFRRVLCYRLGSISKNCGSSTRCRLP